MAPENDACSISGETGQTPSALRVLFFSRGRGRGHAVPDLAIVQRLEQLIDPLNVKFASYGTGARTLRDLGREVLDLGMADNNDFLETAVRAGRAIMAIAPDLIVAHEEFSVPVAAAVAKIPSVFITDFFLDPTNLLTHAMTYAEQVIFLGQRGRFTEPPQMTGRIKYVGYPVRPLQYSITDREKARTELELTVNGTVIACMPGSWREASGGIADLVLEAFDSLSCEPKVLVWIAGDDYDLISLRVAGRTGVIVLKTDWIIDRLMVASDLVITRASRTTLAELHALGVPSISLSFGLNWPDDVAAPGFPMNMAVCAVGISARQLSTYIMEVILRPPMPGGHVGDDIDGISSAAACIADKLCRIRDGMQSGGPKSIAARA